MTTHVMVDIETLSTRQDAVVVSVDLVTFDECFNPGYTYLYRLDVAEQRDHHVDVDTVKFWMAQEESTWRWCGEHARREAHHGPGLEVDPARDAHGHLPPGRVLLRLLPSRR